MKNIFKSAKLVLQMLSVYVGDIITNETKLICIRPSATATVLLLK